MIICLVIPYFVIINLYQVYPNLPTQTDFFFEHTPYINILFICDLIVIITIISFLIFIFKKKKFREIPFYTILIGIYYLIKSVLIYLTPMANPHPVSEFWSKVLPEGGMFPSGHTGLIFLLFLFTIKEKPKGWRIYFLMLLIAEIIFMILSRGHYSIDIIGALFIGYTLWKVAYERFRKKLILK